MFININLKYPHKIAKENLKYNTVESYRGIINLHLEDQLSCYQL